MAARIPFSDLLENWLKIPGEKTLQDLNDVFGEKTFAIAFMLLLAPSALPIPTGGVTNILEFIALLLAAEMAAGMRTIWLPSFIKNKKLGPITTKKAVPFIIRRIKWFEKYSRPRFEGFLSSRLSSSAAGLIFACFIVGAIVAPWFSGLDTLPSLGVLLLALGLILDDVLIVLLGLAIGLAGLTLLALFWGVVLDFVRNRLF